MLGRVVIVVMLLALAPAGAHAHAVLLSTEPADGAALPRPPASLRLRFNEPVSVATLRLVDRDGRNRLDAVRSSAPGTVIDVPAPAGLDDGRYLLSYRVVSADGHPVGGAVAFAIGAADPDELRNAEEDALDRFWQIANAANRAVTYGAVLLAAGQACFALLIVPAVRSDRRHRRALLRWTLVAAASLVLAVPLEGAALSAAAPAELLDGATWRFGWSTSIGTATNVSLAGLALLALSMLLPAGLVPVALGAGTLAALAGFGLTGHAATASPRWLMTPAVIAHGLVAAIWIGSLPPLLATVRHAVPATAAAVVRRFSTVAVVAVAVLVAAGTALAVVQLESAAALLDGSYGITLLVKLVGVAALLALAALNKWRLTPALATREGAPRAAARLRRTIRAELAIAAGVIAATAWLGSTPPPRVLAILALYHDHAHVMAHPSFTASATSGRFTLALAVAPAETGHNHFHLTLQRDGAAPAPAPREVTLAFSNPAADIEPLIRPARRERDGSYVFVGPELSVAGDWTVRIEALVSDFEKVVFDVQVPIR